MAVTLITSRYIDTHMVTPAIVDDTLVQVDAVQIAPQFITIGTYADGPDCSGNTLLAMLWQRPNALVLTVEFENYYFIKIYKKCALKFFMCFF